MFVELDVFSGMPNPRWALDPMSSSLVVRLRSSLEKTVRKVPDPPGLGYRGFICDEPGDRFRSYKGYVYLANDVFEDPSFGIELFLLQTLPSAYSNLYHVVDRELRN